MVVEGVAVSAGGVVVPAGGVLSGVFSSLIVAALRDADGLRGLTEDHRSVLLLREVEGMSYDEIAEALEIPKGTVMSRLYHARRNLQHLLTPYLEENPGDLNHLVGDPV